MGMLGGLGEMAGLMKKFGDIQKNMKKMQEELAAMEITGKNAEGTVEVTVSGDFLVKNISISPALIATGNQKAMECAVHEATAQALSQTKEEWKKKLSEAAGGLPIPGMGL